ncbi:EAL domain-containing protein [Roseibium sp.]|uniref:EAL domain-containing protein n=1 Tax=Roseibium sp. TaxID=1936156 RepID=UPI003B51108B
MKQPAQFDEKSRFEAPEYDLLRAAYENLPQPAWVFDRAGRYVFQNKLDREAFGNLIGKRADETRMPKEQVELWATMHKNVLAGETVHCMTETETRHGRIMSETTLVPLIIGGRIVGGIGVATDKTALVAAERQKAAAQARLETLLALSSDWLWEADAEHRLTRIQGDDGLMVKQFPDWTGSKLWEIIEDKADLDGNPAKLHDVLTNRQAIEGFICELRGRDGSVSHFEVHGEPRYDSKGNFLGHWGVARDVTRREALTRRLKFADQIINATRTPVIVGDADGAIEWVNPAFEELTGYSLEEVAGRKPGHFLRCDETDPETSARLTAAIRAGEPVRETILNQSKSGQKYWLDMEIRPLRNDAGVLTGYMAIEADVTALVESRQRLQAIVDNVTAGVVLHGQNGEIIAANPEACSLLHMSEAQMRGQEIMDPTWGTIFPDGRPMGGEEMPSTVALRTREPVMNQIVGIKRPDGGVQWLRVNARPTRSTPTGDQEVVASFVDITAEENHKRELEEARTLLRDVIETIPDAVVAFDSNDRLIMCNQAYRSNYADTAPAIEDGVTFREMLMHGLDIGLYADAGDTAEKQERWLKRRLESYRNPKSILVEKLTDGRWVQIRERVSDRGVSVGVRTDVTSLKRAEEEIRRIADTDSLTGAANRNVMIRELSKIAERANAASERALFGIVDLDQFKSVNDTLGHDAGDLLLQETVARLERFVDQAGGGTVARLGGDEFAFIVPGLGGLDGGLSDMPGLHAALCQPVQLGSRTIPSTVSMGLARVPADGDTSTEIFKSADLALYQAKASGRNGWRCYDELYRRSLERRQDLAQGLKAAIANDQITVAYQPQVEAATGRLVGFEALARWAQNGTPVSPAEFVAIAEDAGLGVPLGCAVIKAACRDFAKLIDEGLDPGRLAINLSTSQLCDPEFPDRVARQLDNLKVLRGRLEFEITETVLLDQRFEEIHRNLVRLHEFGVLISLDDFGTGYGSLKHLLRLPINKVKIDKSFIENLDTSESAATIVRTTIILAKSLGMGVVAEGVETRAQRNFLIEAGCSDIQGFLISKPDELVNAYQAALDAEQDDHSESSWSI